MKFLTLPLAIILMFGSSIVSAAPQSQTTLSSSSNSTQHVHSRYYKAPRWQTGTIWPLESYLDFAERLSVLRERWLSRWGLRLNDSQCPRLRELGLRSSMCTFTLLPQIGRFLEDMSRMYWCFSLTPLHSYWWNLVTAGLLKSRTKWQYWTRTTRRLELCSTWSLWKGISLRVCSITLPTEGMYIIIDPSLLSSY